MTQSPLPLPSLGCLRSPWVGSISILALWFFSLKLSRSSGDFSRFPLTPPGPVRQEGPHAPGVRVEERPAYLRLEVGGPAGAVCGEPEGRWFLLLWPFAFPLAEYST